jgi:hypothetical protein
MKKQRILKIIDNWKEDYDVDGRGLKYEMGWKDIEYLKSIIKHTKEKWGDD